MLLQTPSDLRVCPVEPGTPAWQQWFDTIEITFLEGPAASAERIAFWQQRMVGDRVKAALDEQGQVVGTYLSYDTGLTVPGGRTVTANAITAVTVRATHRRRGALTTMITEDLREAADRGTSVAILIAAEGPIYGRFGFGVSTFDATWEVELPGAVIRPDLPRSGSVQFLPERDLREIAPDLYQRARRPGAIDRNGHWWDETLGITPLPGQERKPRFAVLYRDDAGMPQGALGYEAQQEWTARMPNGTVSVKWLEAATPQAYVGLWRHLLELDLVRTVKATERAVDEALPWLLVDGRRARITQRGDFLWSRLLDPAAALSERRYLGGPGQVTFEVTDPAGWAQGRFRLEVDDDGRGWCRRATGAPELTLDVATLSTAWLGGGNLFAARTAGQVSEHGDGALARLARLLVTPTAPWCSTWF